MFRWDETVPGWAVGSAVVWPIRVLLPGGITAAAVQKADGHKEGEAS